MTTRQAVRRGLVVLGNIACAFGWLAGVMTKDWPAATAYGVMLVAHGVFAIATAIEDRGEG